MKKKDNWLYLITFVLGFGLCFLLLHQCSGENNLKPSRTIITDTIWPDTVFTSIYRPGKPYKVIDSIFVPSLVDSSLCKYIRLYNDTINDSSLTVIIKDSIQGRLVDRNFSYRLKVPLRINTTIIDSIPYIVSQYRNGIYLLGEVGGNKNQFDFSVGGDFLSKQKWLVGYRYGINQKTHNIKFGYRIF